MKKQMITCILAALLLPAAGWGGIILTLNGPANPVTIGSAFWVNVDVSGAEDLFAYQFDLTFPADLVAALGAANGDFLPAADLLLDPPLFDIPSGGGIIDQIANTLTGDAPGVTGSGLLARVQFQALAAGTADIEPANLIFLNSNLDQAAEFEGVGTSVVIAPAPEQTVPEPAGWLLLAPGAVTLLLRRVRAR